VTTRIDRIYCFDYTRDIGHYDSIRDFASEEMTYIGLALSTPKIHVHASPVEFKIPSIGSNSIREYTIEQLPNLNEISKDLAVNSPKYILICYFDGSERYFKYNEQFFAMFKIAFQYKPEEKTNEAYVSPYAIQKNEHATSSSTQLHASTPYATYATRPQQNHSRTPSRSTKTDSVPWIKLLVCIGVFILIIVIVVSSIVKDHEEVEADSHLTPVAEPTSGTILSGNEVYNGSEITIHASSGDSCVVKLKTRSGTERISFYVRAGDTVTVNVPAEYLYVYFASGSTWYGKNDLFGEKTHYQKTETVRDFTEYTWEFTLYPVSNGNLTLDQIDGDEFK
jgi:hypothetical protein